MITALYCIIIFIATLLGALVGLGGGVIIKPVLDLVGHDTVDVVAFLSAASVFAMSVSATLKHMRSKTPFDKKTVLFIALGASAGGWAGNALFDLVLEQFDNQLVKGIQGLILGVFLVAVNIYVNGNFRTFHVKNPFAVVAVGLFLGLTASFLGVGGGPINVAFLVFFFSFNMKEAAVYSVATIFFSQLTKLITIYAGNQFAPYDLKILWFILPAAVLGGILGAKLNAKSNEKVIKKIFTAAVYGIALVNFYNAFAGLFL